MPTHLFRCYLNGASARPLAADTRCAGPKTAVSAVGSASMVSTRLRRRTTRHAPLLCSVLAMSGAEASPRAKLNSSLHRSAHVLGLLVHLALLSAASGWKLPSSTKAENDDSSDGGSSSLTMLSMLSTANGQWLPFSKESPEIESVHNRRRLTPSNCDGEWSVSPRP